LASKTAPQLVKEYAIDNLLEVGGETATGIITDLTDNNLGITDYSAEQIIDRAKNNAAQTVAVSGVLTSPSGYKAVKKTLDPYIKKNKEKVKSDINDNPNIPKDEKEQAKQNVDKRVNAINAVPEKYQGEPEIVDAIQNKQELEEKAKEIDPVFQEEIKQQVDEANVAIQGLISQKKAEQEQPISETETTETPTASDVEITAKALEGKIKKEADVIKDGNDLILKHGTPHDFTKFQLEKIGTGEGQQAFGYGLYFTDGSKIAEQYAKKLSEDKTGLVYEVRVKDGLTKEWVEWREPLEQDIEDKLRMQLKTISDSGKRVVLVGPPPMPGYVPSSCLARQELSGLDLLNCNFKLTENTNHYREQALLQFENAKISVILLSKLMCQSGECVTSNAGEFLYGFGGHLSPNGSKWLGRLSEYPEQILHDEVFID
jgi:hypothetical protein